MSRKFLACLLVFSLLVTFTLPSASLAAPKSQQSNNSVVTEEYIQNSVTTDDEIGDEVEAAGKTGWLIKMGLEVAEQIVRYGGSALSKITKYLDADTAKYLKNNSSKIAKGIADAQKKINELEDYTQSRLSAILQQSLSNMGVPKSYAVPIGDAIATAVMFLI